MNNKTAQWLKRHKGDAHVRAAQKDGYRSRAAYKLLQIHAAANLFAPGMRVADLGAAPGGWSQVLAKLVGKSGRVVAADLLDMPPIAGVDFVRGDFAQEQTRARALRLLGAPAQAVVSDMAPNLSGVAATDQQRALDLALAAVAFAEQALAAGGALLIKAFEGAQRQDVAAALRGRYDGVRVFRPAATRAGSRELYLLAGGKKEPPPAPAAAVLE